MSETKHTPLPWEIFENQHVLCIMKAGTRKEVVHWAGFDSSDFLDQNSANAKLIVTSVNARPKMEELLKSIRESDRIYDHVRAAAREVEAALKGEA